MQNDGRRLTEYVRRVQEDAQKLTQDLLKENEQLRTLAASFENENAELRRRVDALEGELDHNRKQLQQQLADIEKQSKEYSDRFVEVEQQSSHLTNLYVATYQLHGTLDRAEVLAVIQEIIINLVGSEEMAVFEIDEDSSKLNLIAQFGLAEGAFQNLRLGDGIIGKAAQTGQMFVGDTHSREGALPEEEHLTVCFPLKLGSRVRGVIAVLRLLQHKRRLEDVDH